MDSYEYVFKKENENRKIGWPASFASSQVFGTLNVYGPRDCVLSSTCIDHF
jgi:hypothetical protein